MDFKSTKQHTVMQSLFMAAFFALVLSLQGSPSYRPQYADPLQSPWCWTAYPQFNDLNVNHLSAGHDGVLWFSAIGRLIRYDGIRTTAYPVEQREFRQILAARNGRVFAAEPQGLWIFKDSVWVRHPHFNNIVAGLTGMTELSDGRVFMGSSVGLIGFNGDQAVIYRPDGEFVVRDSLDMARVFDLDAMRVFLMFEGRGGDCYAVLQDRGLYALKKKGGSFTWHHLFTHAFNQHTRIWQAKNMNLWIADSGPVTPLLIVSPSGALVRTVRLDEMGGTNIIQTLLETPDGAIWVSGHSKLHLYRNGRWQVYSNDDMNLPLAYTHLDQDASGRLWFCLQENGVFSLDYSGQTYETLEGLHFQGESEEGERWFLTSDGRVVRNHVPTGAWTAYGVREGVIDMPVGLKILQGGEIWGVGTHDNAMGACRLKPGATTWERFEFPVSGLYCAQNGIAQTPDGKIWFGAGGNPDWKEGSRGGLVMYDPAADAWTSYYPPRAKARNLAMDVSTDGLLWIGTLVHRFVNDTIQEIDDSGMMAGWTDDLIVDSKNNVWMAKGGRGVYRFDGNSWTGYTHEDGLASNKVSTLFETLDGHIWAGSDKGISRFTGEDWIARALPEHFAIPRESGTIRQSRDGAVWINLSPRDWYFRCQTSRSAPEIHYPDFRTVRYMADAAAPETEVVSYQEQVSHIGDAFIVWRGFDAWNKTLVSGLQYSWRFDDAPWSPFSSETQRQFAGLASGKTHTFEVRARDQDMNVDATPARIRFRVEYPLYKHPVVLIVSSLVLIAFIGFVYIIVRRGRHLSASNRSLGQRTEELIKMKDAMEASYQKMMETGRQVSQYASQVSSATAEINEAMNSVNQGSISQSEHMQETRQAMQSLMKNIYQITYEANTSAKAAEKTSQTVESGTSVMLNTLNNMQAIEKSVQDIWEVMKGLLSHSERIGAVVQLISEVASKVNVLALNANIEAVKAGEYGQGFRVVAHEIRGLARHTADSTTEIVAFIDRMRADIGHIEKIMSEGLEKVKASAEMTTTGRDTLNRLIDLVSAEKERLKSITTKIQETQAISQRVDDALNTVDAVSRENLASVVQVTGSTEEMAVRMEALAGLAQELQQK